MESEQNKLRYLGKLERCYNMLQYFKTRIDSYLYEPSTITLFETKAYLKDKIKQLVDANESLLNYMKITDELLPDQSRSVDFHMKETAELESSLIEYTSMFKNS
ncbi:hypothetical protein [Maribacter hydrothermalis]|uniref:Uncharacterized protein n=1 Tax=Maribacter hydrothermalis TaxID=1836467 RepID=A0A1B7Z8N2_9FLAO|nr:hypothetical protein [Maribacter hydrothermalis]APQ19068.1 hypothetical protein BTR34_17850 [Maribacter hydrothermalis]OBR38920.1 hypothetical protein A9200_04435 [Maribacter hydrothermalis]